MPDQQTRARGERRGSARSVRPAYEDAGLFKRHPCIINVALVPQVSHNRRHDLIVRGLLECGTAIQVVFAGRRAQVADPIEARLRALLGIARARASKDDARARASKDDARARASKDDARERGSEYNARSRASDKGAWSRASDTGDIDVDTVRLFARIHGAWRPKFSRDHAGWETRSWQFMAAQWTMLDGFGTVRHFGEPPYLSQAVLASLSEGT